MLQTSLAGQLRVNATLFPNRVAIEMVGGESLTYKDAWHRVNAIAERLREVVKDEARLVAFLMPNCVDAALGFLACQLAECVAVPLNTRLADSEILFILEDSGASTILWADPFGDRASSLGGQVGAETVNVTAIETRGAPEPASTEIDGTGPLVVGYTSGTTGLPKGGLYSGDMLYLSYAMWARQFKIDDQSVVLTPGPMFHLSYAGLVHTALLIGARARIMAEFTPAAALEDLARESNWAFLVPTMAQAIIAEGRAQGMEKLDHVRFVLSSGASISADLLTEELDFFPNAMIGEAYGWSEGGWVTYETKSLETLIPQCVGWPVTGSEIRILDDDRTDCAVGEPGEIAVRNMVPFLGYLNHPEKTRDTMWGGFVLSGDIGIWTDDGRVLVVDRKKDMIVTGGENVYSAEVERVLSEHPRVEEVAVIGRPDDKWGEAVTAVVVTSDAELDADTLRAFCRERIADYKVPKQVEFRTELPRNAMGKLQKFLLR